MRHGGRVQEDRVDRVDVDVVDGLRREGHRSAHGLRSSWAISPGFVPSRAGWRAVSCRG